MTEKALTEREHLSVVTRGGGWGWVGGGLERGSVSKRRWALVGESCKSSRFAPKYKSLHFHINVGHEPSNAMPLTLWSSVPVWKKNTVLDRWFFWIWYLMQCLLECSSPVFEVFDFFFVECFHLLVVASFWKILNSNFFSCCPVRLSCKEIIMEPGRLCLQMLDCMNWSKMAFLQICC